MKPRVCPIIHPLQLVLFGFVGVILVDIGDIETRPNRQNTCTATVNNTMQSAEYQWRSHSGVKLAMKWTTLQNIKFGIKIVPYGLRDIYAKFKSTILAAYQDIHV